HGRDADSRWGWARSGKRGLTWCGHSNIGDSAIHANNEESTMGKLNMGDRSTPSRRQLLAGAAAGLTCATLPQLTSAKAPMQNTQAPGFYRFKVGAFEATVVSDGPLHLGAPAAGVFSDVSKEQMTKELDDNFLPTDDVALDQNALVINTGDRVVLFD